MRNYNKHKYIKNECLVSYYSSNTYRVKPIKIQ